MPEARNNTGRVVPPSANRIAGRSGVPRFGPADEDLAAVAQAASREAGGANPELLGDFLPLLAEAAGTGRRLDRVAVGAIGASGRRAAEQGVPIGQAVELYVSAAWRLWRLLPVVSGPAEAEPVRLAGEAVLRVVNDALAALADGYLAARRQMVRREEALRRELIDDLLRGDPNVAGIVERAEPFGLDLTRPHQVALALPEPATDRSGDGDRRGRADDPGPVRGPGRTGGDKGRHARRAGPGLPHPRSGAADRPAGHR